MIDGAYRGKLGDLVLDAADVVVWLDLPFASGCRACSGAPPGAFRGREELWNGNKETLANVIWGRESLLVFAVRSHFRRRRDYPAALASRHVVRLRTPAEVERFLTDVPGRLPL